MLLFIAHFTPGSKSTIRCADKMSKFIMAPRSAEAVGQRVLLVGCEMERVEHSY